MALFQFVDSIGSSPTVRLDINSHTGGLLVDDDGLDLSPPPVRRSTVANMLTDGELIPDWAYGNRLLKIPVRLLDSSVDGAATKLQQLGRELARDRNILRVQLGTVPYFFRTFAAPDYAWSMTKLFALQGRATLEIPAEPFAYGLREDVGPVTVNNDPAAGSNGMFFDLSSIKGDVETPLMVRFTNSSPLGVGALSSAFGVRRRGTPASMPLVLQCESMTLNTDTTLPGNDAVMSGGGSNYARCSFATMTALTSRAYIARFPSASSVDVRGTYRVFLRKRQSASDPVNIRLSYGGSDLGAISGGFANDLVATTGTNRKWIDLGLVSIPASPDPVYDGYSGTEVAARGIMLAVEAQRVSGSGNLDLDVLLFVPADDRLGTIRWTTDAGGIDNQVLDGIADAVYALEGTTEIRTTITPSIRTGGVPYVTPGVTNRIVWIVNAGENNLNDDKTHTTTVNVSYWPRYLYLRPVST